MNTPPRSVALFGATGLVGAECLDLLEGDPGVSRIDVFVRRAIERKFAAKTTLHVVDFDNPSVWTPALHVDQVLCALGTTINKAGSQAAFRRVDFDYPLHIARTAQQQGARHFLLVSALGATSNSKVFYSRVKGELDDAVLALPFRSHTIVRPSLLLGPRKEFRLGEKIGEVLAFLAPAKYKPVHVRDVARALVDAAAKDAPGRRIIESREIGRSKER